MLLLLNGANIHNEENCAQFNLYNFVYEIGLLTNEMNDNNFLGGCFKWAEILSKQNSLRFQNILCFTLQVITILLLTKDNRLQHPFPLTASLKGLQTI